jgi:hypothetical protein
MGILPYLKIPEPLIEMGVDHGTGQPVKRQGQSAKNFVVESRPAGASTLPRFRFGIKPEIFDRFL